MYKYVYKGDSGGDNNNNNSSNNTNYIFRLILTNLNFFVKLVITAVWREMNTVPLTYIKQKHNLVITQWCTG
jgi:hypothetical protein